MKNFAQLYRALDQSTKANSRIKALVDYFNCAQDADKVWVIALLFQKRPKRIISTANLRKWSEETTNFPSWLFESCYKIVGDITETISLITPNPSLETNQSLSDWIQIIIDIKDKEEEVKKETIQHAWNSMDQDERLLFNKLITGGFRISVSQKIMIGALSNFSGIEENKIAHRLTGQWDPVSISFDQLVLNVNPTEDLSKPYPFYLAESMESDVAQLGNHSDWMAERKWDGMRCQLVVRQNEYYLWSSEEELISEKFPELDVLKNEIKKDVVIAGDILPLRDGKILNYSLLQSRIGRKNISKKLLEEIPVIILASDLLEYDGEDMRNQTLDKRRKLLESIVNELSSDRLLFSDEVKFNSWDELEHERIRSRAYFSDGIILKKRNSQYRSKCEESDWWAWKADPLTIDAVLIYVQRGIGQKAKTYTEFTFAVKNGEILVPFTKVSSGLSEEEIEEIALFVKNNTVEKFGPVRSIAPELVFEIEFDGIYESARHKSGVALRFPMIRRWKRDKSKEEINTLADLNGMLADYGGG